MRRVLLTCWVMLLPLMASAQDFTSLFLEEHQADSVLVRVTISPKMMGEILESDSDKDEEMVEIISSLKSMQILSSDVNGEAYYRQALKMVEDRPKRFEPFLSYEDQNENCQIVVRKRSGSIVELIMLVWEGDRFAIINFTGEIRPEFISTLTRSMTRKHS